MRFFVQREKGFTLIEAAVVILLLSIALIPIINMLSNRTSDGNGNLMTATKAGRVLSEEQAVANTIMEKAIAGDNSIKHPLMAEDGSILSFNNDGQFVKLDTNGNFTTALYTPSNAGFGADDYYGSALADTTNRRYTYPRYRYGDSNVFYQWVVSDASMREVYSDASMTSSEYKTFMPKGNNLVKGVLRVFSGDDARTSNTPEYTVSTYFFKNTTKNAATDDQFVDKIGIVLATDISGSMHMANATGATVTGYQVASDWDNFIGELHIPENKDHLWRWQETDDSQSNALPLRYSSGLSGQDTQDMISVAAPYLTYRPNKNDLFFGAKVDDNPITPYDERYNPCHDAESTANYLPDLPDMTYSTGGALPETRCHKNADYEGSDIDYGSWDSSNHGGDNDENFTDYRGTGDSDESRDQKLLHTAIPRDDSVLVDIPTIPQSSIASAIESQVQSWYGKSFTFANEKFLAFNKICIGFKNAKPSTTVNDLNGSDNDCLVFKDDGNFAHIPNDKDGYYELVALDIFWTQMYRAYLFASNGNEKYLQNTLSRIEAARTGLLSFVETIEANSGLVNNFRLGFVPFSTEVIDGGYTLGMDLGPNEVIPLSAPSSGSFTTLKESFFRINRACNFSYGSVSTSQFAVNCPSMKKPIAARGQTNIAHALYYSEKLIDDYEASEGALALKMVILLTDGDPTASASSATSASTGASTPTQIGAIASDFASKDIRIYSIGLLTGGNTNAQAVLSAIESADPENVKVEVNSVGDLTPVFENIAQQAEKFVLEQMKKRYGYLDYQYY